jgi:hypothetical protein
MSHSDLWPPLPLNEWQDTYRTLHMWTQIVGKIRMTLSPPINHWWHVTLYVNSHGLTTGPVPYAAGVFEIQFDFQKHAVNIFDEIVERAFLLQEALPSASPPTAAFTNLWHRWASRGNQSQAPGGCRPRAVRPGLRALLI